MAPSISGFSTLKSNQKLDFRAQMRTYDGSYSRYALAIWIFSILITKIFAREFLPIGITYVIYGSIVFLISFWRNAVIREGVVIEESEGAGIELKWFKTSGNVVALMCCVCVITYLVIFVLAMRI